MLVSKAWFYSKMQNEFGYVEWPVSGIWNVEKFETEDNIVFEREDAPDFWTGLIFEAQFGGRKAFIKKGRQMERKTYTVVEDNGLEIDGAGKPFRGRYDFVNTNYMILTGKYGADSVRVELQRKR
jgi:hypothetical protein